jgi:DNA-binding beta-propeller fold protein YncE
MPRPVARRWLAPALAVAAAAALVWLFGPTAGRLNGQMRGKPAPALDGGLAWLNTAGPIKIGDLKGKVVVLDFWTFCCINCIHTLPDLAKLEKKYEKELVVIGVHSAKFDTEKVTENIRKAMLRYQIAHPVVNDADHKIWDAYGVSSWPSIVVIDPEGNYLGEANGEGNYDLLDGVIANLIKDSSAKGTLNVKPLRFDTAKFRDQPTPLAFPGKVHADAASNRLFIADSTHHRIVVTDLAGKKIAIAGTGQPGKVDGPFATAQFDDPQGLALDGETLYVADRRNHSIRAFDLKAGTVRTAAGLGKQVRENRDAGGPALQTGLNSPWDLLRIGRTIFIAMAGHHQIWTFDLDKNRVDPYAGDGRENIRDGNLRDAEFAQPSGLATDGASLFVADSEVSAVRQVGLNGNGDVKTLVGRGLFVFGDKDGIGVDARLQHALGVAFAGGKLYVADTYNSKLKVIDPQTRECRTFLAGEGMFNEPGGLSAANGKLYIADTNAHRIRVVDLATRAVSTLELKGVEPVGK